MCVAILYINQDTHNFIGSFKKPSPLVLVPFKRSVL